MKKILMIAVMAVAALNANAQAWVGGEIGFISSHTDYQGGLVSEDKATLFTIKPEVGYSLNEKFDVALAIGFTHSNNREKSVLGRDKFTTNTFEINPYVRYKFVKVGGFFAFVDGGVGFSTTHFKGFKNNENSIGANITPGVAYAISPKVTLVSHLGEGLYYNHVWMSGDERPDGTYVGYHQNNIGFRLFNGITFGAYVSL